MPQFEKNKKTNQKLRLRGFEARHVLKMSLNFYHFEPHVLINSILIKKKSVSLQQPLAPPSMLLHRTHFNIDIDILA